MKNTAYTVTIPYKTGISSLKLAQEKCNVIYERKNKKTGICLTQEKGNTRMDLRKGQQEDSHDPKKSNETLSQQYQISPHIRNWDKAKIKGIKTKMFNCWNK